MSVAEVSSAQEQMTPEAGLKRLGFVKQNEMKLYGIKFEILNDPIVLKGDLAFIDGRDKASGEIRRVRVPLPIMKMVRRLRSAA